MPKTQSLKLGYADDWVLAHQSRDWKELETVLSKDTTALKTFFDRWYLRMNTTKTVSTTFHLNNHEAEKTLKIQAGNASLPTDKNPKYLGVTLDRCLTYKKHLEESAKKIAARNSLIRKLTGTSWGAGQTVLRTSALALCYSVAEYCAPVWTRCNHTNLIDVKLRDSMRIITGCLKSTPVEWLPVMSAIPPPNIRREEVNQKWIETVNTTEKDIPLKEILSSAPKTSRLKSRRPFYLSADKNFNLNESWRREWRNNTPAGGDIIVDPTIRLPGFQECSRKEWVTANRIRSRHNRTEKTLFRWGMKDSPICPKCQEAPQDTDHLVLHCPSTSLEGGYETVNRAEETFRTWIQDNKFEV